MRYNFYQLICQVPWTVVLDDATNLHEETIIEGPLEAKLQEFASFIKKYGEEYEENGVIRQRTLHHPYYYWVEAQYIKRTFIDPFRLAQIRFFLSTGKATLFPYIRLETIEKQYIEHLRLFDEQEYWIDLLTRENKPAVLFPFELVSEDKFYYAYIPVTLLDSYTKAGKVLLDSYTKKSWRSFRARCRSENCDFHLSRLDIYGTCRQYKSHLWAESLQWAYTANKEGFPEDTVTITKDNRNIFQSFASFIAKQPKRRVRPGDTNTYPACVMVTACVTWGLGIGTGYFYWIEEKPENCKTIHRTYIDEGDINNYQRLEKAKRFVIYKGCTLDHLQTQIYEEEWTAFNERHECCGVSPEKLEEVIKNTEEAPYYLREIPQERITEEMIQSFLDPKKEFGGSVSIADIPEKFQAYIVLEKIIRENPWELLELPPERQSRYLIEVALQEAPDLLIYLPDEVKKEYIFNRRPPLDNINCIPLSWRNYDVSYRAVSIKPSNLKYVPEKFRDYEMCYVSTSCTTYYARAREVLLYFPKQYLTKHLCARAVARLASSLEFVPKEIITPDFFTYVEKIKSIYALGKR